MKKSIQFFKNLKPFRLLFLCVMPLVFIWALLQREQKG